MGRMTFTERALLELRTAFPDALDVETLTDRVYPDGLADGRIRAGKIARILDRLARRGQAAPVTDGTFSGWRAVAPPPGLTRTAWLDRVNVQRAARGQT